jgi:SAM-dependent methyltransferase
MERTPSPPAGGAGRDFYEALSARELPPSTVRGIRYRNLVVAGELPPPPGSVLEIGPGEGWLCRILAERGYRVTTCDLARGWLPSLAGKGAAGSVMAPMTRLPFAGESFDAVLAVEVIEHIPEIGQALAEAARVLRRGGLLVVTVPYRETLRNIHCPECGAEFEPNGHVHSFDEAKLRGLVAEAGLDPVRTRVGNTRFAREILRRAPIAPLLPLLQGLDRLTYRSQRVSDTWLLTSARRP